MYLPGSNITLHIHCKHTKTLNSKEYVALSKRKSEMALKELEFVIFFSVLLGKFYYQNRIGSLLQYLLTKILRSIMSSYLSFKVSSNFNAEV